MHFRQFEAKVWMCIRHGQYWVTNKFKGTSKGHKKTTLIVLCQNTPTTTKKMDWTIHIKNWSWKFIRCGLISSTLLLFISASPYTERQILNIGNNLEPGFLSYSIRFSPQSHVPCAICMVYTLLNCLNLLDTQICHELSRFFFFERESWKQPSSIDNFQNLCYSWKFCL